MLGIGLGEFMLIGVVLLLVVGPERLPGVMRYLGRIYGQLRRAADELRRAFVLEADRMDSEDRYKELQERRKVAEEARRRAMESAGEGTAPQERRLPGIPEEATHEEGASAKEEASATRPGGFSDAEWSELPDHVKELVLQNADREGAA